LNGQEIRRKRWSDPKWTTRSLPIALLRTRELLMQSFRPMLQEHDVTEQQWRVLRILFDTESIDAGELAGRACILAPSLSRISKALETRGLVQVRRDPLDGRRSILRLTAEGIAFMNLVAPQSAQIYAKIEAKVGRQRIDTLIDELDALILELAADE
jgi:homoprotocatechuate degradation operon regulator, HpaR